MRWLVTRRGGKGVADAGEALMALAALAGNTVVAAATTDAWEAARRGFARLLGRGDPKQQQLAERRLEETREQLTGAQGADLEQARAALAARWAARLADLLEEDPGAEADLRALVQEIQAAAACRGGVRSRSCGRGRAGCEHQRIRRRGRRRGDPRERGAAKPYPAGSGEPLAGPGDRGHRGQASVVADRGGIAVGQLRLPQQRATRRPAGAAGAPAAVAGRARGAARRPGCPAGGR